MKVMGADVSSSCTGVTLIDDGELVESVIWKPINKKALASERLFEYYQWISGKLYEHRPDLVAVSSTTYRRNPNTTRVLSRYEGATIVAARVYSCDVVDVLDVEARKAVLKRGNTTKERAYQLVTKKHPDYPWLPYKDGGNDQTDSYVIAKAAPALTIT